MADLRTQVAGITLSTCVYNASGPRSGTAAALQKVCHSKSGAVLSKSATIQAQTGNPQPRTWHSADGMASLNSEGLPNNGIDYYIAESTIQESMESSDKPYIVSLSGKTLADNLEMLKRIAKAPTRPRIAAIELNLACPNVIGKPIIAYDFEQMDQILTAVSKVSNLPPLGVKLPPYLDFQHFAAASDILNKHKKLVRYIASINTIGNALAVDVHSETPTIASNSGYAGLSGPVVKYTALANVCKFRSLLDPSIDVVGVGGISSGTDVFEMLLAGAVACQVATCHWKEGPSCFDRICDELASLLKEKGYSSVSEIQGTLKPWSKDRATIARQHSKPAIVTSKSSGTILRETYLSVQFYQALSCVLSLLLAVAMAQHWTNAKLLPSE